MLGIDPPPVRIAVLRALFLGDLLCATPALRALRRRFPAAEITLIGLPWAVDLVARLPYLDCFAAFPGYPGLPEVPVDAARTAAFLARARGAYDLAIQLHGSGPASNGFVAALGAGASLGYRLSGDDGLSAALPWDEDEHEVRRWLRLVGAGAPGAATEDARLDFPTTPDERRRAVDLLAAAPGAGPLVGLHAGAKDPSRRWPPAGFAALADRLVERYGARVVLSGSVGERDLSAAVRAGMRAPGPALDLAGATDLGTFAALVGRLDLLVTNDTGASHLAAAAGTPSVVLFGPTRPARWAPLDRARHRRVDAAALASGVDPAAALAALPVEPVLAACAEALGAGCGVRGAVGADPPPAPDPIPRTQHPAPRTRKDPICAG